jgi:hypothetical protein
VGDGGVVCLGDWAIETISNRATRDLRIVSNLVNATSEFPLTYRRGLLRGVGGLIGEDLVPGGVGIASSYPPVWGTVMERVTGLH